MIEWINTEGDSWEGVFKAASSVTMRVATSLQYTSSIIR